MKNKPVVVNPLVIDKLAYVLPWGVNLFPDDLDKQTRQIKKRIDAAVADGTCESVFVTGGRYRFNVRIKLPGGCKPFVQIGALIPHRQKGGVRVTVNPTKFQPGDVEHFHQVMRTLIGKRYPELNEKPLINCLDAAVDVHGVLLTRMLIKYQYAQQTTMFGKRVNRKGAIESYNFGSVNSDYMTTVYDKRNERVHDAVQKLLAVGRTNNQALKDTAVKQFYKTRGSDPYVRIEIRGKKMRGVHPGKLRSQVNRFARFKFAILDPDAVDCSSLVYTAFASMCRDQGVKAALAAFKSTKHSQTVSALWLSRDSAWWKPELVWSQVDAAVRGTELFPHSAFVER